MGYFSNGSEGDTWESWNCEKCLHDAPYREWMNPDPTEPELPGVDPPPCPDGCPLFASQMVHNYDGKEKREILDELIPIGDNGFCGRCTMFLPKD